MNKELPFCECGCGLRVTKPDNRFIHGHNQRGKDHHKPKPEPQLCECGCGEYALPGNKFIFGHGSRKADYFKPKPEPKLCECGCGLYALPGNRFILGHNLRDQEHPRGMLGKVVSPETRLLKSKVAKGVPKSPEHIAAAAKGLKNFYKNNPEALDRRAEAIMLSEAHKIASKNMEGGNDIIEHHYIYDHANPEKYTMKVTRKKHPQIHMWMRKSGIKVPHINMTEENKNVFGEYKDE